jgi:hypothetical protein
MAGVNLGNIRSVPRVILERHAVILTLTAEGAPRTTVLCLWDPEERTRRDAVTNVLRSYFPGVAFEFARVLSTPSLSAEAWMAQALDGLYAAGGG